MKVRALVATVFDGDNGYYTQNDEFDVTDDRGKFLLGIGAVERVADASILPAPAAPKPAVKRVSRKTDS